MENNDLVDTVQEFRLKYSSDLGHDTALHPLVVSFLIVPGTKTEPFRLNDRLRAGVGSHDDTGIFEIDLPPVGICDVAFIQDLKQYVKYIRMSLLDLIEQDHTVWMPPHLLGELASLVIAHIAGRRSDHLGYAVFLHVLRHVNADQVLLRTEYSLSDSLGKLSLSDAGRSQKKKRSGRTVRVLDSDTPPLHGSCNSANCFILAYDSLMKLTFKSCEASGFGLRKSRDRYLSPTGNNFRDCILIDGQGALPPSFPHLLHELVALFFHGFLFIPVSPGRHKIAIDNCPLLEFSELHNFLP